MKTPIALLALMLPHVGGQDIQPRVLPPANGSVATELNNVYSVRELSDGRVLVAVQAIGDPRLLVANFTAGTVAPVSRQGSGPGEYERVSVLTPVGGDTTVMLDGPRSRTLVLVGSRVLESNIGSNALEPLRRAFPRPLGTDAKSLLVRGHPPNGPPVSHVIGPRDSLALMTVAISSGRVDTVARLRAQPGRRIIINTPSGGISSFKTVQTAWVLGEAAAMCHDAWIAVVRMEPYRVDWRAPDSRWTRGAPIPFARVAVTERDKAAWTARNQINIPGLPPLPFVTPDWPSEIPPQGTIFPLCAPDGRVLILRNVTADRPSPLYDIVDRRGVLVDRFALAENQKLIGFGPRSIYVVTRDANDLEQLKRYPYP